jgi:hypothetical protein
MSTTRSAIQKALDAFEAHLREEGTKLSMAEYIKLLQLSQELADDEPKEITVRWVETPISKEA